jgi:hypothetical protein
MIRRVLILAGFFFSCPAFATWNPSFSSTLERMTVGETRTISLQAVWSGLTYNQFSPWVCVSDDKNVAIVQGGLKRLGTIGEVKITAVRPGTAYVQIVQPLGHRWGPFVKIIVQPQPVRVTIASSAMTSIAGRPLTLVAIGEPAPLTFTWYRGHLGDTAQPLPASGEELTVTPTIPGRYDFWVLATAPHGVSSAEFTIDVVPPPRRQAVGRR